MTKAASFIMLLLMIFFLGLLGRVGAAQLVLVAIEMPREVRVGQPCKAVFKVEGDLRKARNLVAQIRYLRSPGNLGKANKKVPIDLMTREYEARAVHPSRGVVVFKLRFNGPGDRMAACRLRYTVGGNTETTDEVKSTWFSVRE